MLGGKEAASEVTVHVIALYDNAVKNLKMKGKRNIVYEGTCGTI